METLLNKAQELNNELTIALQDARKANAEANSMAAETRIAKKKIDSQLIDIQERENLLRQGENAEKTLREAKRIQIENVKLSTKLSELKVEFLRDTTSLGKERSKVAIGWSEVKIVKEELAKLKEEYKEKIKNAKDDVLAELKKKIR